MRLIGMLDSPYVRRVAISLKFLGLPFTSEQVSVFRHFDQFSAINPVVKAPTLVTENGVTLMDSTLILEYAEALAGTERRLAPAEVGHFARAQRIVGLALAACEKTVQIVYEHELRPEERRHQPWIDRVRGQLACAYELLDTEIGGADAWLFGDAPMQADITAAVAWRFTHHMLPGEVSAADHPALDALSVRAEALPAFRETPLD
jgi:glutathione S-transferase